MITNSNSKDPDKDNKPKRGIKLDIKKAKNTDR